MHVGHFDTNRTESRERPFSFIASPEKEAGDRGRRPEVTCSIGERGVLHVMCKGRPAFPGRPPLK
jgi:hypothetical protein